jgi:hypothetical protein
VFVERNRAADGGDPWLKSAELQSGALLYEVLIRVSDKEFRNV